MCNSFSPEDRQRLALKVNVNPAVLYQTLSGKGSAMSPRKCVKVERDSEQELRRWHLRPNDWHLIWPELIGAPGAPAVPADADQAQDVEAA